MKLPRRTLRWQTAKELLKSVVAFWNSFFDKRYPRNDRHS
jgi:hypothetical protein